MDLMSETITLEILRSGCEPVVFDLPPGSYSIGRDAACKIRLRDPGVSEHHAVLLLRADGGWIEDLNSSNGTCVNDAPVEHRTTLRTDDTVAIGSFELRARFPSPPVTGPAPLASPELAESVPAPATPATPAPSPTPVSPREGGLRARHPDSDVKRAIKAQIHRELVQRLDIKRLTASHITSQDLENRARETIANIVGEVQHRIPKGIDPDRIGTEVFNEALRLGPLEDFLEDETITEIMVNGPHQVYVERAGRLELTDQSFLDEGSVLAIIERIVSPIGRRIDESQPYVDARLADGSRVNAIIHPLSLIGPCLTIRKFSKVPFTDKDLIRFGTLTPEIAQFLEICLLLRKNTVVSGGTGSGKTSLLNVLSNYLPATERIVTIEDAAELRLGQPHLVRLEARPPNIEGRGSVPIRDLVRNALRMRPDRIIVGECRGGEALDMLQAMNTGHDGSLTTVHANAPRDVIARLETMVLMSGMDLPSRAIREQIASAIDLIVHEARFSDGSRKVTHVTEVVGLEGNQITMQDLFVFTQTGIGDGGKIIGRMRPTGAVPTFFEELGAHGLYLDPRIFQPET